ncbi:MAG: YcjX family protein [Alishewanella sp.]|nr:YcjX family protein [Alishewanella sp.]MDP5037032.1 YcjX family protein [Alishewanella sp.]MDP5187710.1 YcjX family protein [Alishewanella sp.]
MSWLESIQYQSQQWGQRALDRHLRLGVTGLSGAGKTAFITSLVHQLTLGDQPEHLPFFAVVQQGRYLGGRLANNQPLAFPRFPYEQNVQYLQQQPATWPPSTAGWSQLNLTLRYKSAAGWRSKIQQRSELQLELVDYPGEWLLDLPMLQQDYQQWSTFCWTLFEQPHRQAEAQVFADLLANTDLNDVSELQLQRLTDAYLNLLHTFRENAATFLHQPGRLLVPGELAGAPMLKLFPLLPAQLKQDSPLLQQLSEHYHSYCDYVIKPFYRQHFSRLDRQVVLVDCLSALNAGFAAMQELQQALGLIMQSFRYGPASILGRLFKPQINKVLFAASKADHVTPEQHKALTLLLQQLLQQPIKHSHYASAKSEAMALAAIRASSAGFVQHAGQKSPCISGVELDSGNKVTLFPGEVPAKLPDTALFNRHPFQFPALAPLQHSGQQPMPHVRMDHALEFLLGDKLQ